MSKAFELISESLNEIIDDLEKNNGANLKREVLTINKEKNLDAEKMPTKHLRAGSMESDEVVFV